MASASSSTSSSKCLIQVIVLLLCQVRIGMSQSSVPIALDCYPGWENVGLNCYKLFVNRLPWVSAERTCLSYGGHLATPFDFYENKDMGTFVNDRGVNEFWIGAGRMGVPPNDNRVLQYSGGLEAQMWVGYWSVYQPKFSDGDCVYVSKDKKQLHKWSFGPCEIKTAFLCQRPVCSQGSFHCVNGKCVSPRGKCDGLDDCGDRSDETNCSGNCNVYIKVSAKGNITYPIIGLNYPNNADCSWLFEADVGYNLQLIVTSLSLESNNDELIVMDGGLTESRSKEIVRLTGSSTAPKYFYSSDNKMLIKLRSDGSVTSSGFSISYELVNSSQSFQSMLTATDTWQELEFPYYKNYLLGNQDLSFIIEAQDIKQTVTVEILDLELPGDASAIVRNGKTVTDRVLAVYTGSFKGSGIVLSTGRYIYIALHTARGSNLRGLKIRYMQGCGGSTNQSTGYIYSPGYPVSVYPNSVTCKWVVNVNGTTPVPATILFTIMDVHVSDRIQIIEGNTVIGSYSGNSVQNPVRINSGQFSVTFISSATLNSQGFNLTYSVDCPKPAIDLSLSVITGTLSESYGTSFTVSCKQGSRFSQAEHMNKTSVTMICNAYGLWNVNTSPRCEAIRCTKAPGVLNGYIARSSGNLTYGGTVTYNCYQGFKLVGSDTVRCDENGQWVNIPSCQASMCGSAPQSDPNGSQNVTLGDGNSFGSVRRYYCNQGYDLIGGSTMFCDSNGVWIGTAATCKSSTCYMSNIPNGVLSSNKVDVGQIVTLSCITGYRSVTGETAMTCNSNRTFTPILSCQNINECLANNVCQHNCTDTEGSYYCQCNPGFEVNGGSCRDINECAVNPCSHTCTNTEGSYQCSCPAGHSLFVANGIQGYFIPVGEDGTLAGDVYRLNHSCVRNLCPVPPSPANTDLLSVKTNYYYNDTVMYRCQLGYNLENPLAGMLSCDQTGNWTGLEIKCIRAMCAVDVPSNLINPGTVSPVNKSIGFGEQINITCNVPGFTPSTFSRIRKCTLIGVDYSLDGSIKDYECGFISCGKPGEEPGSNYIGLSTYYYNNNFTFSCRPSFKLEGASVLRGNSIVTCQDNRQWDFGTLRCTGIQCLDPGQPYLGKQVSSDYRDGQLVTFTCLLSGYSLRPPGPISCGLSQSGTPIYNGSVPVCVDTQPPIISKCPQSDIIVDRKTSAGSAVPELLFQDNGGIQNLTVSPAWPHSKFYVTTVQTFTYTVTDYGNNQASCSMTLRKKDDVPPTIVCPLPYIFRFRSDNDSIPVSFSTLEVYVNDDVTPISQLNVTFSSPNYTFTSKDNLIASFPQIRYDTVLATVKDAAGNSAFCNFGVFFKPFECSPYYIRTPPNSNKVCTAINQGYNCTITCKAGYTLYNNVTATSASKVCYSQGAAFLPDTDIKCVNLTSLDGSYKLEYDFTYEGSNISNSCKTSYENIIKDTLKDITDSKSLITQKLCETAPISVQGKISLGYLTVAEAEKKVYVRYIITFDRRSGSKYSDCAESVKLIMSKPESYLPILSQYRPLVCENITLTTNRSLFYDGYYCEDDKNQLVSPLGPRNLSYCISCPEGTYSNNKQCLPCPRGTYGDMPNMGMCTPCQQDTSTYSTGAVSRNECSPECVIGTTSATGLPPCYLCPLNMYWANSTTCMSCPPNTLTRANGSKNIDDCRAPCPPGYYNEIDGHTECQLCPMHTYSNLASTRFCLKCNNNEYTNSSGKTSSSDCLKLGTQCPCLHGRCTSGLLDNVISCVCENGWMGENCSIPFNPCDSHPCYNGGNCAANESIYTCSCFAGTSGKRCEEIIKTCTPDYCQNNGMCENFVNARRCHCLPGFTGERCETAQDICASQPCKNGGNCNLLGNVRFSCSCPPGLTGKTCEESKDDCYASPCRNNGTCRDGSMMSACDCDIAYTGQNCEVRKQLCSTVNCGQGAKCFENARNSTYMCLCNEYTETSVGGAMICMTKNFCVRNPCMNNGTCASRDSSFTCTCPFGFTGSMCQHNINDCLRKPCSNGGQCQDLVGGFKCNCTGTGFEGDTCNFQVNDCASQTCNVVGTIQCQDMIKAYQCLCKPGYTGKNCEIDINECDSNPCLHNAACVNMENNYMCQCPAGWVGRNCETENKICTPVTCLNEATCYDYFNGYYCQCKTNTNEKNCSASVNVCQVANPCVHGTCQDKSGKTECICDNGYIGDQCEMQRNFCSANMSVCMNSGQCIPQLDDYKCKCPQGYLSKDCSKLEDRCSFSQCPVGSTCYNTEEKQYCRCPLEKEGPNCDKAWDQDFDLLFDHEDDIGMAYLPYSIKLSSTSFSISVWLQFLEKGDTGTILSFITVPSSYSLRNKLLHLWIDEKTIYYSSNGTVVNFTHDIIYNDGRWHYLVVNVNRSAGVMHFIVDTINSLPINFPATDTLYDNIWLVLGAMYDTVTDMPMKARGFYGKLSKVTVYSRELQHRDEVTILGNTNVSALFPNSILRWSSEWKYSACVIRKSPSEADRSCPFGYTNYPTCNVLLPGKMMVKIASGQCSSDIIKYTAERLTQVFWPSPTFIGQESGPISSFNSGDAFVWGKYPVVIKASNADGNTALCLFNIFVQNDNCTNPQIPPNAQELQCSPTTYEKYKQCSMTCKNLTAPSIASPRIHTCGPVGNWDPLNKFVPYRLTPCGATSQPMQQLVINMRYSVPTMECSAVVETLEKKLRETQVNLNNEWNYVCTQSNCSDTQIRVACQNKRRRRQADASKLNLDVVLTLNDTKETVVSRTDNSVKRTEDLYKDVILDPSPNNKFDYSKIVSDAAPTLNSIDNMQMCNPPKVFLENICVDCGPGTFYNGTEKECQFCPIGSYQPLSGQITCDPCPQTKTTITTGSNMISECYDACPAGQYMNMMNTMCTNCSRGFYQPQSGQFICLPCPADKTTKYTGTKLASDCSNDCPPGQEIGTSNNCTVCRIGFYRGPNDAVCQRCPNETVTESTSKTSVADCNVANNPPGTKRRKDDAKLYEPCPVGTYQDMWWQSDCVPCAANYLTNKTGSTNVTDCIYTCPAGQELKPKEDRCVPCMLGYYRNGSKPFDPCDPCPARNYTLSTGATSQDNCTLYRCGKGEQPNANNICEPCPKGSYQEFPDKPKCDPCSTNKSTQTTGSTSEGQCESYCSSGLEKIGVFCQKCPIEYFKDNSENLFGNCTLCRNSNYVTPSEGAVSNANCTVLNCQEGYKANLTVQKCDPCPRGTYQNKKYQTDCITCPQNTYTRQTNSTRPEDCEGYCNSGYEKNGTLCSPCQRGYYKDNNIDVFMACTACDIKYVTPEGPPATTASQCTVRNCREGTYINGDNCTPCAKGFFQDRPWQTNCTKCDVNRNTENEGTKNKDLCLLSCPAGTENNGVNATCDLCSIGYYKDKEAAVKCSSCANFSNNAIRISVVNGSTSISNCSKLVCLPGYYPVNDKLCTMCGYGTFQPEMWRDSCNMCPPGRTTYKTGAIDATDCEFGCALGEGLVNGTCKKCEVGFYNDKSDPSRRGCFQCPTDKITQQEGTTSATLCNITDCSTLGQYRDPNDNTCKNCIIGSYQDKIRQDFCKNCPSEYTTRFEKSVSVADCKKDCQAGYYLNDINNLCEPCAVGFYRNKTGGNWDCVSCSGNLTTASAGSTSASDCSVASCKRGFAYDISNQACIICPKNTYTDMERQFWPCKQCPSDKTTDGEGSSKCDYPCASGDKCNIVTQVCVNAQFSYRCDCKSDYQVQIGQCVHKCDIPNYCGPKGECIRSPFNCNCRDSYTGALCDIRPDAAAMSSQETETIIIAVVTTLAALLFLILLVVSLCVMVRRRRNVKTPRTSEIDEHTNTTTRSMKGFDDYPTFAVNPAFSSKPPSVFSGQNGALSSQGHKMYNNPTYSGDEEHDPAVYRA